MIELHRRMGAPDHVLVDAEGAEALRVGRGDERPVWEPTLLDPAMVLGLPVFVDRCSCDPVLLSMNVLANDLAVSFGADPAVAWEAIGLAMREDWSWASRFGLVPGLRPEPWWVRLVGVMRPRWRLLRRQRAVAGASRTARPATVVSRASGRRCGP